MVKTTLAKYTQPTFLALCLCVAFIFTSLTAQAAPIYRVDVNTNSINGTNGFIDLQFSLGQGDQDATAVISNFSTMNGVLGNVEEQFGDVTGMLPGQVQIGNSAPFNNLFQSIKFGSNFSFNLTFTGPAVTNPNGFINTFFLSLYGSDKITPLLVSDPNEALLALDLQNGVAVLPPSTINPSVNVQPIPEPATMILLGMGLAGVTAKIRKQRASSKLEQD